MREDLNKLLCERERPRSWDHYSNYRNLDRFERQYVDAFEFDDDEVLDPFTGVGSGSRESMKYRYGYDSKQFNENLNPLWGVVRKNVGRKWDKVYSELCEVFDKRSVINQHILTHLFDFVELNVVVTDGKLWVNQRYYSHPRLLRDSDVEYYVDPRDGILKRNAHRKSYKVVQRELNAAKKVEEAKTKRVVDADTELHLINGVWFEVKFAVFEGTTKVTMIKNSWSKNTYASTSIEYPYKYDVLLKKTVNARRVAVSKQTINHKNLKRHGLAF
jgi:hypothetical protein